MRQLASWQCSLVQISKYSKAEADFANDYIYLCSLPSTLGTVFEYFYTPSDSLVRPISQPLIAPQRPASTTMNFNDFYSFEKNPVSAGIDYIFSNPAGSIDNYAEWNCTMSWNSPDLPTSVTLDWQTPSGWDGSTADWAQAPTTTFFTGRVADASLNLSGFE
jgi:hypothetical protein